MMSESVQEPAEHCGHMSSIDDGASTAELESVGSCLTGLFDLEVADVYRLTPEVVELRLIDATGRDLPDWTAGSHIDLRLGNGMVRQYSLCGTPARRDEYRVAVLREPMGRGGSRYIHEHVARGDRLRVVGVRNTFQLTRSRAPYVLVAGGIGITPLLPMIGALRQRGADWTLHYGGRSRTLMPYAADLAAAGHRVMLYPQDEMGLLPLPEIVDRARSDDASLYACGPTVMLDRLKSLSDTAGGVDLHLERFVGAGTITATRDFTVNLVRSGLSLQVPPESSVLEILEEHGVNILSSCRSGVCGTCEVTVLAGTPEHHDSILDAAERDSGGVMFPCVSRALSADLDLDL